MYPPIYPSAATTTTDEQPDALAHKIETLVLGIKRRSQRINKEADGCKARARFLRKNRKEKELLSSVLEDYNKAVPSAEALNIDTILSLDTAWPWQLQHSGMYNNPTASNQCDPYCNYT